MLIKPLWHFNKISKEKRIRTDRSYSIYCSYRTVSSILYVHHYRNDSLSHGIFKNAQKLIMNYSIYNTILRPGFTGKCRLNVFSVCVPAYLFLVPKVTWRAFLPFIYITVNAYWTALHDGCQYIRQYHGRL